MKNDNLSTLVSDVKEVESVSGVDYNEKVLEVKGLKKYFTLGMGKNKLTIPAVDNVSFDVYKREVFGLVGESGCGKTTTGRTIIKLYEPTDGSVDLNGIQISAGIASNLTEIKRIKKQLKEDTLSLNVNKSDEIKLRKEAEYQTDLFKSDIIKLRNQYRLMIKEANTPIEEHQARLYNLKNIYILDKNAITFELSIKTNAILHQTENQALTEYDNEVRSAKLIFKRKFDGMMESAALSMDTIKQNQNTLKEELEQKLIDLKTKFDPLIEAAKKDVIDKAHAKAKIAELKKEAKAKIADRKVKYEQDLASVVSPDTASIAAKVAEIKAELVTKEAALNAQIADIAQKLKADVEAIKVRKSEVPFVKSQFADRIKELETIAKAQINEQKEKINQIKKVNRSKDTLLASQKMQMIFQDPISSLNPRMTVREIISEGLVIQGHKSGEELNEKVAEVLQLVGLAPEYASRYPHEFSGGQRQRIGIARALIMNPNFIIADEPISALDVSIRAQVINLLTKLKEKLGLTILFVAHDLSVVRFFCDRIAVMYYGKIVELTTSQELFANPLHPYTKSLLSAIPQPDPDYEKGRTRINYNPRQHDYRTDLPSLREVKPGHMVYVNEKEYQEIIKDLAKESKSTKETTA